MQIIANYGQQKIADAAINHIMNGITDYPFEFSGGPGTGKSVVLNMIKEGCGIKPNDIAPMSYIGQAAVVMRLKGFHNAKTAHSWLLRPENEIVRDSKGNIIHDQYLGGYESEFGFVPKPLEGNIKAIFVDEAGSMPEYLRPLIEAHNLPVVVAGDINQLPPVASRPAYLAGSNNVMYLTEVMRQKHNSGIIYIADRALKGLPIHYGCYGDAIVINEDQLTNEMLLGADLLLCGTNKTRDRLNHMYRTELLGITGDLPRMGEKVICRKNNWNMEVNGINLANGLRGTVMSPVEISMFDGKTFWIDFQPDLFDGVFEGVDVDYEYFNAPCTRKNELKNNRYSTGEKFDFAYCITVHLAQGGQARNVIYFEDYNNSDLENRINFTGATRASENLIYVKKRKRVFMPSSRTGFNTPKDAPRHDDLDAPNKKSFFDR